MSEQYTIDVDTIPNDAWDDICCDFLDLSGEQVAAFSSGHWKGRDSHILLRRDGEPVAGARVAIFKLPLVGRGTAYLRFGPFWRRKGQPDDPAIYRRMIAALHEEYCVKRGHCLTILPRPHPDYHAQECALLRELGFENRRPYHDADRFVVNTSLDAEAQLKSLAQKWRYNLRQAQKNELDVRLSEDRADVEAFKALHASMTERKKFVEAGPIHLATELMTNLPPDLKPKLFIATHEGKLVAGALLGIFGDAAYYLFGATSSEALPLRAGYALQWEVVQWLHENGYPWYDLGGIADEPGLRQFKAGLVGKAGRIVTMEGELDRWESGVSRLSADVIFKVRDLRQRFRQAKPTATKDQAA